MSWVDDYLDAWNRHDSDRVTSYLSDDCVYVDQALGESHTGHADIKKFIDDFEQTMSTNYRFDKGATVIVTEAGYAVEWTCSGTNDRGNDQFPNTGKDFSIQGVSVGELRNGKIVKNTDYWSLAEYLMQVGLMPAPAGATA